MSDAKFWMVISLGVLFLTVLVAAGCTTRDSVKVRGVRNAQDESVVGCIDGVEQYGWRTHGGNYVFTTRFGRDSKVILCGE